MPNTLSSVDALLKQVHADSGKDLVPKSNLLQRNVKFVARDKQPGNYFNQPMVMQNEQGFTYNADGSAYTLNSDISAVYANARIRGTSITGRSRFSYDMIAASGNSKNAFIDLSRPLIKNLLQAASNRQEIMLMHGQVGLGTSTATTAPTATTVELTISVATWAEAIWAQAIGAQVDVYGAIGDAAPLNTVGAMTVAGYTTSGTTYVVTLSGAAADVTAINADETVVVFFRGAKTGASAYAECLGLFGFSGAATFFDLSTTTYPLAKPKSYSAASAAMTHQKLQKAAELAINLGVDSELAFLCSPATFNDLMIEQQGLIQYPRKGGETSFNPGASKLSVAGLFPGSIDMWVHPFCKRGEALLLPKEDLMRIGTKDITVGGPEVDLLDNYELLKQVTDAAAMEFRTFQNVSIFHSFPSRIVHVTGIVNNT